MSLTRASSVKPLQRLRVNQPPHGSVRALGLWLPWLVFYRLHRLHETQTIVTDDRDVCPYVCQSVCHAAQFGSACTVYGVIQCSLCQITLASCYRTDRQVKLIKIHTVWHHPHTELHQLRLKIGVPVLKFGKSSIKSTTVSTQAGPWSVQPC